MSQIKERNIVKRVQVATRGLRAYSRLAARYHDIHYLIAGMGEVVRDFIAGKDTMLEEAATQLCEFEADQELMETTDHSPYVQ